MRSTGPTAAIASIVPGVQSQGLWAGRRQLFVRFAGEAETATLFTPEMLMRHVTRLATQVPLHSISISGRDPLACSDFLVAAFENAAPTLPVMLDCDGQRSASAALLVKSLTLIQVTVDFSAPAATLDNAIEMVRMSAGAGVKHAVVLALREGTSDSQILRLVEQVHAASPGTKLVVHPVPGTERPPLDRRYATLLEQAMAIHRDIRLQMRVPAPVGTR
jgi:hypothetical protein